MTQVILAYLKDQGTRPRRNATIVIEIDTIISLFDTVSLVEINLSGSDKERHTP